MIEPAIWGNPMGTLYLTGPGGRDWLAPYPQGHSCFVLGGFVCFESENPKKKKKNLIL